MDTQEFTLHDGTVSVKVKGNGNNIALDFDITDVDHAKPVINAAKFEHATLLSDTIRRAWAVIANREIPEATLEKMGSHLHLSASFEPTQMVDAMAAVRGTITNRKPVEKPPATTPPPELSAGDDDLHTFTAPRERVPDLTGTRDFLLRLQSAETEARGRQSLRRWVLENQLYGITSNVFPIDASVFTGKVSDEEMGEKQLVAIRITPGKDTIDARAEITRLTTEVRRVLLTRNLNIRLTETFLGTRGDGSGDSGVILVDTGTNPVDTVAKVNNALEYVQEHLDVLKAKLGSGRGEDHRQRRDNTEQDPAEATLLARLREAEQAGVLKMTGTNTDIGHWVKVTTNRMRQNIRDQDNPPPRALLA